MVTGKQKSEAKRAWERQGVSSEALAYLDLRLHEWKGAGVDRETKIDNAWRDVLERFPISATNPAAGGGDEAEPDAEAGESILAAVSGDVDVRSVVLWVASHLDRKSIQTADAPHPMAYSLWKWGGDAQAAFWNLAAKVLAKPDKDDGEQRAFEDDRRKQFGLIELLAKELEPETVACPSCGHQFPHDSFGGR